ncbi:MAG: HU family DNA-binding protein [Tannerellaceae bacterium]
MALKYKTILRKDMRKGAAEGAKLVYGITKATGLYSFQQMCDDITDTCSATEPDVRMVISAMVLMAKKAMLRGETVVIDGFGNLQLKAGSTGVENAEDFKVSMMKAPRLLFRASKSLLKIQSDARFEMIESVEVPVECDKTHSLD